MVKVCHYFSCICDCIVRFRTIVFIYLFVGTYPLIRAAVSAFVGSAQMSTASTEPVSLFTTRRKAKFKIYIVLNIYNFLENILSSSGI